MHKDTPFFKNNSNKRTTALANNFRMDHRAVLERLCRICGRLSITKTMKTKYLCKDFWQKLTMVFAISTQPDDPNRHPTHFCHACKLAMVKAVNQNSFQHQTITFQGWCAHAEDSCAVCEHFAGLQRRGQGRPKKVKRTPGRPPDISPRYCMDHIRVVAPPPLSPSASDITICEVHLQLPLSAFHCPICCDIFSGPIELVTCGNVVCAECACKWLEHQQRLTCPCCYTDHLNDFSTIRQAPALVVSMVESLCVICVRCKNHIQLKGYRDHSCQPHQVVPQSSSSIDDLLHQPSTAPLTPIEQKLQTSLARRSLTEDSTLHLRTGGKVKTNAHTHNISKFPCTCSH